VFLAEERYKIRHCELASLFCRVDVCIREHLCEMVWGLPVGYLGFLLYPGLYFRFAFLISQCEKADQDNLI